MDRTSLFKWIEEFQKGNYDSEDKATQVKAGWFDWFCDDFLLSTKTKIMGEIISQIRPGGKVDLQNTFVWFKNNAPIEGPLFDDFRIADIKTEESLFVTQIDCPWNKKKYVVYGRKTIESRFLTDKPLFATDFIDELIDWFNTPWFD